MTQKKKRRGRPRKPKDETKLGRKNIRMDLRTEWAIDLWALAERTSDTAFIENAIDAYADALAEENGIDWQATYHPHRAVCWLRAYLYDSLPFPDDHQARRAFVLAHCEYFYHKDESGKPVALVENAEALFGPCADKETPFAQIDAFRKIETEKRGAARAAMAKALKAAGLSAPAGAR